MLFLAHRTRVVRVKGGHDRLRVKWSRRVKGTQWDARGSRSRAPLTPRRRWRGDVVSCHPRGLALHSHFMRTTVCNRFFSVQLILTSAKVTAHVGLCGAASMRQKWVFWVIMAVLVVLWGLAQLPRVEQTQPDGSATTYRAGLPMSFAKWDVWTHNGETVNSTSSPGKILVNALPLGLLIGVAWFFTRPRVSKPRHRTSRSHF